MDESLKQRLVGASVLVSLVVIFVPMLLSSPAPESPNILGTAIPPKSEEGFSSRIVPLDEPATPMLDARETVALALGQELETGDPARTGSPAQAGSVEVPLAADAIAAIPVQKSAPPVDDGSSQSDDGPAAWAVQLGSFSSRQNAVTLRDRLRENGYVAFVESAVSERGEVTRVFVGPELDRDKAVQAIEDLREQTNLRGIVVRYPRG